jgi:hypothetical protein
MSSYRDTLQLLPPNRKKAKATRDLTLKQVIAMQTKRREEIRKAEAKGEKPELMKTLTSKTIECYMTPVSTFLTWCVDHGQITGNPAVRLCKAKPRFYFPRDGVLSSQYGFREMMWQSAR